jgi:hypothetical protein
MITQKNEDNSTPISASARVLFALLAARAAFGLAYLVGSLRASPIPWYYPLERRWVFEGAPTGFAMAWYGRTAAASIAGAAAFLLAWVATVNANTKLARALTKPSAVLALARAVGLMMLVDFAYFGWVLTHQTPDPLPLPPGFLGL